MNSANAGLLHALRQCDELRREIGDHAFDATVAAALQTPVTPDALVSPALTLSPEQRDSVVSLLEEYEELKMMLASVQFRFRSAPMLQVLNQLMATLPSSFPMDRVPQFCRFH